MSSQNEHQRCEESSSGSGSLAALPQQIPAAGLPEPERVERPQFAGNLYVQRGQGHASRQPALMVIPEPGEEPESLKPLLAALCRAGFTLLFIEWGAPPEYPESLAILPGAIAFLNNTTSIDPQRIGALGIGAGADLVLRSASTDPQITSVLGLNPYLSPTVARAGLLAKLRTGQHRDGFGFAGQLGLIETIARLRGRPARLLLGSREPSIDLDKAQDALLEAGLDDILRILDEKPRDLPLSERAIQLTVSWFSETLSPPDDEDQAPAADQQESGS